MALWDIWVCHTSNFHQLSLQPPWLNQRLLDKGLCTARVNNSLACTPLGPYWVPVRASWARECVGTSATPNTWLASMNGHSWWKCPHPVLTYRSTSCLPFTTACVCPSSGPPELAAVPVGLTCHTGKLGTSVTLVTRTPAVSGASSSRPQQLLEIGKVWLGWWKSTAPAGLPWHCPLNILPCSWAANHILPQ